MVESPGPSFRWESSFRPPTPPSSLERTHHRRDKGSHHSAALQIVRVWSPFQSQLHINYSLAQGRFPILSQTTAALSSQGSVLVRTDSMVVVTYFSKQIGHPKLSLCKELIRLLRSGRYPSLGNTSRARTIRLQTPCPGEGSSPRQVLFGGHGGVAPEAPGVPSNLPQNGSPHIDLFVSRHNHQLPTNYLCDADPISLGRKTLTHDWSVTLAYAFPPITLESHSQAVKNT